MKDNLDGDYTYDELRARIAHLNAEALLKGEWSAQAAGRSLWLQSQYEEQWDDLEKDEDGRAEVEEREYKEYMQSLCDDYAYADVYENGPDSLYSWMVWCCHWGCYDFDNAVNEYRKEHDLPVPSWADYDWDEDEE